MEWSYQEFKPSKKLGTLIDAYWFYSDFSGTKNNKVLPDGCADLIFNLGVATSKISEETAIVSGMMTRYSVSTFKKGTSLLGIRFKPGQLSVITELPLFEIKNKIIDSKEALPYIKRNTISQLKGLKSIQDRILSIEKCLLRLIAYKEIPQDKLITSVTDFILHTQEIVSINNLAKEHGISLRQLERRFKAKVGLTLKEFQCVTRFTRTMNSMRNKPAQSILAVAFENGYYDHSHLTNEFKKMSGSNPSSFK